MAYPLEIILTRQMADCLSVPVFIVNTKGDLLFYNEPAEHILGKRFQETGEMSVDVWSTLFQPCDEQGNIIPPDQLPLVITLNNHIPAHKSFWIKSLDNKTHKISVTSYPLIGRSKQFSGAVAIFWTNQNRS